MIDGYQCFTCRHVLDMSGTALVVCSQCAERYVPSRMLSDKDLESWRGLVPTDLHRAWLCAKGYDWATVALWMAVGVSPAALIPYWDEAGYSPALAGWWVRAGIEYPERAAAWTRSGASEDDIERLAGTFQPDEWARWHAVGFEVARAVAWREVLWEMNEDGSYVAPIDGRATVREISAWSAASLSPKHFDKLRDDLGDPGADLVYTVYGERLSISRIASLLDQGYRGRIVLAQLLGYDGIELSPLEDDWDALE